MKTIQLGPHIIGSGHPCFIIAEAGVNHNGDPAKARELITSARESGADSVKFQTWVTENLVTRDAAMAEYQVKNTGRAESQFDMLKRLELSFDDFRSLKVFADGQGIQFLSTPDEETSADFLDSLGAPGFKIGSGEVTNLPFLRHVARKGKPIILSTGMSTLEEVRIAVRAIESEGNRGLVLLHCVSQYPAQPADCNLHAMDTLKKAFGYPVGFSDHTVGIEIAVAAVALGACVIEKHFTLDPNMPGPDHKTSLAPRELAQLVRAIREVESALGDGIKKPMESERDTKKAVQRSVVAARAIGAGTVLTLDDLCLMRSPGGLEASQLDSLVGHKTMGPIAAGEQIRWEKLK